MALITTFHAAHQFGGRGRPGRDRQLYLVHWGGASKLGLSFRPWDGRLHVRVVIWPLRGFKQTTNPVGGVGGLARAVSRFPIARQDESLHLEFG